MTSLPPTSELFLSSFSEMNLRPEILRSITEMGFETPSPIQEQAIPQMLGRDVDFLGLAGTGTGKTAAFAIPLLERIDLNSRNVQALILCPTRELAMQVSGQISLLGKYLRVKVATVYGGAPFGDQVRALHGGAQIVVGTPGRVIDHLERKTLKLEAVRTLILDEADEMFSMGFKEEIDKVVEMLDESNTWLFSATMSPEVRRVVNSSLVDPITVQVSKPNTVSENVEQLYFKVSEGDKPMLICKLIESADEFYGLVFCQTKALVADLTRFMLDRGYKVDCLHGDMDQNSRERTMQAFRDRKLSVLICTDVAARGLDVKDVTHVINYSLPREMESYVHRIGRTARSGKTGIVMNLVTFSHRHLLGRIENHTRARMSEGTIPSKREIAGRKLNRMLASFENQPLAARVFDVMNEEFKAKLALMTPEEVAANFIVMMMPDTFIGEGEKIAKPVKTAVAPRAEVAAKAPAVAPAPVVAAEAKPVRESRVARAAALKAETLGEANALALSTQPTVETTETDLKQETSSATPTSTETATSSATSTSTATLNVLESVEASEQITEQKAEPLTAPETAPKKSKKKSFTASLDLPPRSRREVLSDDEVVSLLEEPAIFGVVKATRPEVREERSEPRREAPRPQAQFRSGPRDSMRTGRFDRAPRPSRPEGLSRPMTSSRPAAASGPVTSRPAGSALSRPVSRPAAASAPSVTASVKRAEAPMNLGKPPKHEAGPARTARQGETGGMNRRARRALQFGGSAESAN